VRLWAAAEALLASNETAIYTYAPDRAQHVQTVEKARQLVSAERWTMLWNEGQALTQDEAIALARHTDPERLLPGKTDETGRTPVVATNGVLTPREVEVLQLIAQGQRNRSIAERLVISEKTVQNHVSNIFAKLGVEDRSRAIIWAMQHELIDKNT
jgi:DNA-binding NarL/FixJ family response regulator